MTTTIGPKSPTTVTVTLRKKTVRRILRVIEEMAEDTGYGHFPGGDPRDFTPDPECSTEEERAAHKRDCEAMEAGGQALMPPTGEWHRTETAVVHFHRDAYGLGTYVARDPKWSAILAEVNAAIVDGAVSRLGGYATPKGDER